MCAAIAAAAVAATITTVIIFRNHCWIVRSKSSDRPREDRVIYNVSFSLIQLPILAR